MSELQVQRLEQLIAGKAMMLGDGIEYGFEGADLERIMLRDGDVELAIYLSRQSHVRSSLARLGVSDSAQDLSQVPAADVPWESHRVSTSSRT